MALVILKQIKYVCQRTGRCRDGSQSGLGAWLDDGEVAGLRQRLRVWTAIGALRRGVG